MVLPLVLVAGAAIVAASAILVRRYTAAPAAVGRHRRTRAVGFDHGGLSAQPPVPRPDASAENEAEAALDSWPGEPDELMPWWHRSLRVLGLFLVVAVAAAGIAAGLWVLGHLIGNSVTHYFKK